MNTGYTEQDTEQARQFERSSAGQPTQNLTHPSASANMTAAGGQRRNNLVALSILAIGVLALLGRFTAVGDEAVASMVLLSIGACFLFFAFWKRIYALTIPGCILAGLSIGAAFVDLTNGASIMLGLAMGFMAILIIGRSLFAIRSNWPVYPAIPLFAVGVGVAASSLPSIFTGGLVWLPLLLIGLGLYLGWGRKA